MLGAGCEVDDQLIGAIKLNLHFVPAEHIVGGEDALPVEKNLSMCVESFEDEVLMLGGEDGGVDGEGGAVGGILGLVLVEL